MNRIGLTPHIQEAFLKGGSVDDLTEEAALKLLAGAGSLLGVGISVEIAGFSAYILAAKASSIIPLVGYKTLISTLAVLANPLFIVPAILGGGVILSGSVKKSILENFGIIAVTILILKAIAENKEDAKELVEVFKNIPALVGKERVTQYINYKASEESDKTVDKVIVLANDLTDYVRNQMVTDKYPELHSYLDRYYELKG